MNEKTYTESDMETMRALWEGCKKGCQDLRNLLRKLNESALVYRGYSPVDLDDDETFHLVELALNCPAEKDAHEWVNKKRFDELHIAYCDYVDHHAKHHRKAEAVLDKWARIATETGDEVMEQAIAEIREEVA